MTIYEIDDAIRALVDEDGEISDFEAFEALQMEREAKIENAALYYKELLATAKAIKAERDALKEREDALAKKADRLKGYIDCALGGEKFSTARVAVSWRSSEAVEISPYCEAMCRVDGKYLRYKQPEIDRAAIKEALKNGERIAGAEIVKRQNIQIK